MSMIMQIADGNDDVAIMLIMVMMILITDDEVPSLNNQANKLNLLAKVKQVQS